MTQRGNRRERVFFEEGDYALYRDWLGESCRRYAVEVSSLLPDAEPRSPHPGAAEGEGRALAPL
jgi:putative transposase